MGTEFVPSCGDYRGGQGALSGGGMKASMRSIAFLNHVSAKRLWADDSVQFEEQSTSIAEGMAFGITPPERGSRGAAVGTDRSFRVIDRDSRVNLAGAVIDIIHRLPYCYGRP